MKNTPRFFLSFMVILSVAACAHDVSQISSFKAKQYVEQGKFDDAIREGRESVSQESANVAGWYWLGVAYFNKQQYHEAIPVLKQAIGLMPGNQSWVNSVYLGYDYLGWSHFNLRNYNEALSDFNKVLENNPKHVSGLLGRALSYQMKGMDDEALKDCNSVLAIEPKNWQALLHRGWIRYSQGQFSLAKDDFDAAEKFNEKKDSVDPLRGKAFSYLALGDSSTAMSLLNKAREIDKNYDNSYDLSLIYYVSGDKEKAWKQRGGRGRIGIEIDAQKEESQKGILVKSVLTNSAAEKAGILKGDVIIKFDNIPIDHPEELVGKLRASLPGNKIVLTILRESFERQVTLNIESAEPEMEQVQLIKPILAKRNKTAGAGGIHAQFYPPAGQFDIEEPPAQSAQKQNIFAVVIGIENYRSLPKSDYSGKDALLVKSYLKSLGYGERNIELITDEKATKTDIEKALEAWLPNRVKKNSSVLVYFSGHGSPDPATGEAYIVPYDGDPNYLSITGYSLKRFYENLGKLEAKEVIVVLDSCFSGAGGRSVLARGARPLVMQADNISLSSKIAVMTSTQGSQISTSSPQRGHGIFTYYFLKSIKEGKNDLADIYEYIKPQVEDEAKMLNVQQSPSLNPAPEKIAGKFILRK